MSSGYELCGFVPMRGIGAPTELLVSLAEGVDLRLEESEQAEVDLLRSALSHPWVDAWSGVTVGAYDRFDGLHLWLAMSLPSFGLLIAEKEAADRSVVAHAWGLGVPTAVHGGTIAYLGLHRISSDGTTWEFGAYGHGPDAEQLVHEVVGHIRSWDGTSLNAHIEVYPAETPDDQLSSEALVLDRRHRRVVVSWPRNACAC